MATKILTNYNLEDGDKLTDAIADVGDLVIHATVVGGDSTLLKFTVMAQEGDGGYTPVIDDEKGEANFFMKGSDGNYRIKWAGIDSENVKIQILPRGAVGVVTIEYTKTANNLADPA